ncbi:tRNA (guanosine(37)-N1)-methyltransferase TrmD [Hydrogenimonas urashimensis]|uniref:tRNA (guanosine(37)-N1)-methyltransferase TrmD n=1 Tax=Hydrogenimonas urashimensis TaxID=2740515 RepID=UPI00191632A9|nr:tRNA (guanosine(37)-N1)-methyltransferase TrmD [Hydrogenimonas urashimensis]
MRFTFVTLFRPLMEGYFEDSILKRAIEKGLLSVDFLNPRDFTTDKHRKVDDTAAGGGAGMVMMPQPLDDALKHLKAESPEARIVFTTPVGKPFRQADAKRFASSQNHMVFVSGRYEGIDERIIELWADEVFSIGDYILTGGELPSLVMADAISRLVPGVLGNADSLSAESFETELLEAPSFTRPKSFHNLSIPSELLKGNHSKINALKKRLAIAKTKYFRPDRYLKSTQRESDEKSIY